MESPNIYQHGEAIRMICSNSMYHGDESEIEYEYNRIQESREYEEEERGVDEWKMSRTD